MFSTMRHLYADVPARRGRQIAFDVAIVVWLVVWGMIAAAIRAEADNSTKGAAGLESNANQMSGNLSDAAGKLKHVPLVGGTLEDPFDRAATSAKGIATAAHNLSNGVERLGLLLAFLTAALPVVLAVLAWCLLRIPYARRASRARKFNQSETGRELLALDALVAQPDGLDSIELDPVKAWRAGHQATIDQLADLQLASLGLRSGAGAGQRGT